MDKSTGTAPAPVRYAVRQVLDQESRKEKLLQNSMARHARSSLFSSSSSSHDNNADDDDKENAEAGGLKADKAIAIAIVKGPAVKRDFFGRTIVNEAQRPSSAGNGEKTTQVSMAEDGRVWVSFHEGFSNAVRKPITLKELMDSF